MRITSLAFVIVSFFNILNATPAMARPLNELMLSLEIQLIHLSQVIKDAENERRYDLLARAQVLLEKLKETLSTVIEQGMRQDTRFDDELSRLDLLDFDTLVITQREAFSMLEKLESLVPRGSLPPEASKRRDHINRLIAAASELLENTLSELDRAREPANSYLRFSLYSQLSRVRDYLMTIKKVLLEARFCTYRDVELFFENLALVRAGQHNVERVFEHLTSILLLNQGTATQQPDAAAAADPTFTSSTEMHTPSAAAASEPAPASAPARTEPTAPAQPVLRMNALWTGDSLRTVVENAVFSFLLFLVGNTQLEPDEI